MAEVEVQTPYYSGTVLAVCMEHPIYDLIIGNILGAADPQPASLPPPLAQQEGPDGSVPSDTRVRCWMLLLLLLMLLLLQLLSSNISR